MGVQDLTPQLRTRFNRIERLVGLFVNLAVLLLLAGFIYYAYHTAQRKGWFLTKVPYYTLVDSAAGLMVGAPVMLMGFEAGEITEIAARPASEYDEHYQVYIRFLIREPHFGYLWTDSEVRVTSDFLGHRSLEVTRGGSSLKAVHATYIITNNHPYVWIDADPKQNIVGHYIPLTNGYYGYWLMWYDTTSPIDRVKKIVAQLEDALPGVLSLTNEARTTLTNTSVMMANLNQTLTHLQPIVGNLTTISTQLREPEGSLGRWLIPTNLNGQIENTLGAAHSTLETTETNLARLAGNLNRTLDNLADITSNLSAQVQANSLLLTKISTFITDADDLIQGLKRNWLIKGAFPARTNKPLESLLQPTLGEPR